MNPVVEARAVRKVYRGGGGSVVDVLNRVDLMVHRGEVVAIVGASGAGKSTLLHLLGALDDPSAGEVLLDGASLTDMSESARDRVRNRHIGFVFQFHHLLREFSALENVMMPLRIAGWGTDAARSRAEEVLAAVGLAGRMTHRPAQLSGGEQQRCAVARALVPDPRVLLADEPSGNLDHANSGMLHDLLIGLVRTLETALVVVTHHRALAERADRILLLEGGQLHPVRTAEAVL
ncbi:MAG TPA: ABC transporter ATP-binding protein [Gemmatimonadales bacterium]|nr:ABC transporter ATP-binding protein [Gemmatimonadales bacterium]